MLDSCDRQVLFSVCQLEGVGSNVVPVFHAVTRPASSLGTVRCWLPHRRMSFLSFCCCVVFLLRESQKIWMSMCAICWRNGRRWGTEMGHLVFPSSPPCSWPWATAARHEHIHHCDCNSCDSPDSCPSGPHRFARLIPRPVRRRRESLRLSAAEGEFHLGPHAGRDGLLPCLLRLPHLRERRQHQQRVERRVPGGERAKREQGTRWPFLGTTEPRGPFGIGLRTSGAGAPARRASQQAS